MAGAVIGEKELIAKFRALSQQAQGETLVNTVMAGGTVLVNAVKDNIKKQGLIKTRNMSRSIHQEVAEATNESATVAVGTNLEYAAIHEFGGTIQARNSKYLAIPVGSYTGSPRKYSDLSLRKTGGGNLVMVDGEGVVQYVLKQSVVIPAKPYLRPAADESHEKVTNVMMDAWKKQIEKVSGA